MVANRRRLEALLNRPRAGAALAWVGRFSIPLFLWHTVGYAILHFYGLVGPALFTLPFLLASQARIRGVAPRAGG
ncbi:MAG: hypothetical protein ACRDY7_01485 [Acidimicrobiia bacterium]